MNRRQWIVIAVIWSAIIVMLSALFYFRSVADEISLTAPPVHTITKQVPLDNLPAWRDPKQPVMSDAEHADLRKPWSEVREAEALTGDRLIVSVDGIGTTWIVGTFDDPSIEHHIVVRIDHNARITLKSYVPPGAKP